MKKKVGSILLIILLMITMLFTLTACGDDEESEDKDEKKSTSSSVDEKTTDKDEYNENDVLSEAEIASKKTKLAEAQEVLNSAILSLQSDYMLSSEDSFGDFLTYERLDEALDLEGYELCEDRFENVTYRDNENVEGLDLYMEDDDNEENVYHFVISTSGTMSAKVDTFCLVDRNGKDINLDKYSSSNPSKDLDKTIKDLDEMSVSQFNSVYTGYEGDKIGSNVQSLLEKIISNNTMDIDDKTIDVIYLDSSSSNKEIKGAEALESDEEKIVKACGFDLTDVKGYYIEDDNTSAMSSLRTQLLDRHYYKVACHEDDETGLIDCVVIKY